MQIKRIHGYKRQLLNALRVIDLYDRLRENPALDVLPRTVLFAGKRRRRAITWPKKVIQLITALAQRINADSSIGGKLKVVFLENYGVSLAERIIPTADISEQISTAGKEASGITSNMKFMMNGAITIGTLDGANIEIREAVGADNMAAFGLTVEQVTECYRTEQCNPLHITIRIRVRVAASIN